MKEEVKFLHDNYDKEKLEVDLSKWNICIFDIEVAVSGKFNDDHKLKVELDGKEYEINCGQINERFRKKNPQVFDEEMGKWVPFSDSCYVSIEGFPYAEKAEVPINLITCYSTKTKQTYT